MKNDGLTTLVIGNLLANTAESGVDRQGVGLPYRIPVIVAQVSAEKSRLHRPGTIPKDTICVCRQSKLPLAKGVDGLACGRPFHNAQMRHPSWHPGR